MLHMSYGETLLAPPVRMIVNPVQGKKVGSAVPVAAENPALRLEMDAQLSDLTQSIELLTSERDQLVSSLMDLRQLLARISSEHSSASSKQAQVNVTITQQQLKAQLARSMRSVQVAEKVTGHFGRMAAFWRLIEID